ncbi:hypothetical protein P0D73_31750 [Paraburkholderia sp. RL18-101-BIB-B]|uniref:hypothetical protein n=1 Tax=unclassified Paraburkholderia TaxID=2615204 RepID=UPI0038B8E9C2
MTESANSKEKFLGFKENLFPLITPSPPCFRHGARILKAWSANHFRHGRSEKSERADVYALAVYQKASGVDSTGKAAVASIASVTAASGNHAVLARAGLRFKF